MQKKNRTLPYLAAVTAATVAVSTIAPATFAASFSDIDKHEYKEAIESLKAQGIIDGYNNGKFNPDKQLTRSDVVKMLGKYLVTLGYEIPSDYKTSMRFSDLTPNSQDELLQYAALVYDHGVFAGNQGRLLATQKLSMQHMAVVLVRLLSTIDGFDYAEFVNGERYLQEYYDTAQATKEAQEAINVIDFYDFYKQQEERPYFYPHETATRGQFAHFLYHLLKVESPARNPVGALEIEDVTIVSPTRLTVKLTNGTIHNVVLQEALEEHVPTEVSFKINGRTFTRELTYQTQRLEVVHTEFINSGQFVVHFNQEVTLQQLYSSTDIQRIVQLTSATGTRVYALTKGELSEDRRAFTVTLGETIPVNTRYIIELLNVHAENGVGLADVQESVYYAAHSAGPTVADVEQLGGYQVKVTFSEPIQATYATSSIAYRLADGTAVTGVRATFEENKRYPNTTQNANYATSIVFDLTNAKATGKTILSATPIRVQFNNMRDIAGNLANPNPLTATISKGMKLQKDGTKPKLVTVEQLGAKKMQLVFSEPVEQLGYYDLTFEGAQQSYYIEEIEASADATSFILTMDDYLEGEVLIKSPSLKYIYDVSGEQSKINKKATFSYDASPAKIISTEVIREENKQYLVVTFDRNIVVDATAKAALHDGQYQLGKNTVLFDAMSEVPVYAINDTQIKIPIKQLIGYHDNQHTAYEGTLHLSGIYNEYREAVAGRQVAFTRDRDYNYTTEKLHLVSVETSRTNANVVGSNRILLNFNFDVDSEKAQDLANYRLQGYTIQSATVYPHNLKQVELIVANTLTAPVSPYLSVWGLTADNAVIAMDDYYERVLLNETVAPRYQRGQKTGTHEMTLTYNEGLSTIDANAFIVHNSAGQVVAQTVVNHPTDLTKLVVTFEEPLATYGTYTIKLRPGRNVTDLFSNPANFSEITIYR